MLTLLRLKRQHPRQLKKFLKKYRRPGTTDQAAVDIFRKSFPRFEGAIPVGRSDEELYGHPDDGQLLDKVLFTELKSGFNESVAFAIAFEKPNVIFTDLGEDEWPQESKAAVGKHWVVVIDYHE